MRRRIIAEWILRRRFIAIANVAEKKEEVVNRPDSRASEEFDATVRFPLFDLFRLHSRAEPRDYASLDAVARRIAAAHTRSYVSTSKASLFESLRPSQPDSPAGLARRKPTSIGATQPNQPMPVCPPILPSVLSAHALAGSSARRFSAQSERTPLCRSLPQTDAYAQLLVPPLQPQPNASLIAPTPQTVAVFAAAYSVPPYTQLVSAPVLKFPSTLAALPEPTPVVPFPSEVAVPAGPTPIAPFPSTPAAPPVPTLVAPFPSTVAVQAAPTTVATIVLNNTPTGPPRSRRSALIEDDEWDMAAREIMQTTRRSAVAAPAALAATPTAESALSASAPACARLRPPLRRPPLRPPPLPPPPLTPPIVPGDSSQNPVPAATPAPAARAAPLLPDVRAAPRPSA